nr:hypothetical protein [Herbidospora cretacea]
MKTTISALIIRLVVLVRMTAIIRKRCRASSRSPFLMDAHKGSRAVREVHRCTRAGGTVTAEIRSSHGATRNGVIWFRP